MLGQTGDMVKLALDGVRIVRRKHARVCKEFLAAHDRDSRMLRQPVRRRRIRHNENAPHPWRKHIDAAQRVLQFVNLSEPGIGLIALADHIGLHALGTFTLEVGR